ncbi:response regulator transcription factor [Actinomadura sp. 9N215]|uniref:response regulator transcription factor n=1 Tax=Actinomadura sp. 9N215 TaxID=3375150 RepID=UPI0037A44FC8
MRSRQPNPDWIMEPFMAGLAIKARAYERDPRATRPLVVGPAAGYGRWISIQAAPLDDGAGDVAVTIRAAGGEQILPAFCDWYQATPRERQILTHLRDAVAPKQIARRLDLSVHTVNDHLKAIHRKTGASRREELLAALTS